VTKGGIELAFYGYNHKLPVLVNKTIEEMRKVGAGAGAGGGGEGEGGEASAVSSDLYDRMKEKTLREYANYRYWNPVWLTFCACYC